MYDSTQRLKPRLTRKVGRFRGRSAMVASLCFLGACAAPPSAVCPAIVPYTAAQQTQVAGELDTLPPQSMTRRFMGDYGELRAKLRECNP
jgi:hypothetical protein